MTQACQALEKVQAGQEFGDSLRSLGVSICLCFPLRQRRQNGLRFFFFFLHIYMWCYQCVAIRHETDVMAALLEIGLVDMDRFDTCGECTVTASCPSEDCPTVACDGRKGIANRNVAALGCITILVCSHVGSRYVTMLLLYADFNVLSPT